MKYREVKRWQSKDSAWTDTWDVLKSEIINEKDEVVSSWTDTWDVLKLPKSIPPILPVAAWTDTWDVLKYRRRSK